MDDPVSSVGKGIFNHSVEKITESLTGVSFIIGLRIARRMNLDERVKGTVIGSLGLGYVGLPLAVAMAKHYPVIGYDMNAQKIAMLKAGQDPTNEVGPDGIKATTAQFTTDAAELGKSNFIIVAVPTPVTAAKVPDLTAIMNSADTIGKHIKKGTTVVLESTVYPGVTEEVFGPRIAKASGLEIGKEFYLGYSPERINPGDTEHTVEKIKKIVAGQDEETLKYIAAVYAKPIKAGLHLAPSIKVAEMSKVIENTQRDMNIAFVNELSRMCRAEGIDVKDVLDAAGTKWNFIRMRPGIVGGHCLPEDPWYMLQRALEHGHMSALIQSARSINDTIHKDVSSIILNGFNEAEKVPRRSSLLIMGLTFKENVNDYRHSGAKYVIDALKEQKVTLFGYDPHLDAATVSHEFKVPSVTPDALPQRVDGIVDLAPHAAFKRNDLAYWRSLCNSTPLFFDLARQFDKKAAKDAGFLYLHL